MRLERLEIAGFKSFSDRAELSFDRGVTAIVGPNGCGKSNLADALTWVMGEQSAKSLRGEKMEDVIFSGSDARKPTGSAEVRLRFSGVPVSRLMAAGTAREADAIAGGENGNGNGHGGADLADAVREVEVTRRLYRSGESEYLIDGQVCRLKDIHELLMDTGLGAKAYAIIEQGKIGLILSSRPADRRQLIEEAAGITKYKARRRAAELKLEAAQQNLTRLDDIVYEVERQRNALKRQAAKARRYARLRDEMRRWEKVLFARRYRALGETIESARARLAQTREQESAAAARLADLEAALASLRSDLAESEAAAASVREAAHERELAINRRQQQIALDTQQAEMLRARVAELDAERAALEARREPERLALEGRRSALADAEHARAQQAIEAAEHDVERARAEVYAVSNTVTALQAAYDAAAAQRERAEASLGRLQIEAADLQREHDAAVSARRAAEQTLAGARDAVARLRADLAAREGELAAARAEHDRHAREVRAREQDLASLDARLRSLEELDAHRAGFGDAARRLLAEANGAVEQKGAVADFVEVDARYERAVEAHLGDLLQYVIVPEQRHAAEGLALVRREGAGRCGFVVAHAAGNGAAPDPETNTSTAADVEAAAGAVRLAQVVRVFGEHAAAIRAAIGDALIVESFEQASRLASEVPLAVATLDGDVFRGSHVIAGGARAESRGILATKREIKELRDRVAAEREILARLTAEAAGVETAVARATAAIAELTAALHREEKTIVAAEAELQRAAGDEARLAQRRALVATETARVQEEIAALDARQTEARESIAQLDADRRRAADALVERQRHLQAARETAEDLARRTAEARAAHAALVERGSAVAADVRRMEQEAQQLENRLQASARDLCAMHDQREHLLAAIAESERHLDEDFRALEQLRAAVREADDKALALRTAAEQHEETIRDARRALDALRALAAELDVARATAESDLAHLAQQCLDAVNVPLDEVRAEVDAMDAAGEIEPDPATIRAAEAPDPDEEEDTPAVPAMAGAAPAAGESEVAAEQPSAASAGTGRMTAEEAIAELRAKIDRLGPVNMMAIDQFAELEERHRFLTSQRQDLVDSIAQTNEAIRRIDTTTHARFREAFQAINANFQETFSTLFGGGRAGLTLLDESDPLESGIDIVASPPGKRLQSVMLLSGGEKALTAIALMFAIFKYKPSPFCVLDEIDAPLDDANIGRFVEMLRGMLDRTQFIIITHNRKTMEIANRLYGVTMEEPGVSKLISIQLN